MHNGTGGYNHGKYYYSLYKTMQFPIKVVIGLRYEKLMLLAFKHQIMSLFIKFIKNELCRRRIAARNRP